MNSDAGLIVRGITGLIMKAGVPYWGAVLIKYIVLAFAIVVPLWIAKAGYDEDRREEGRQECRLEQRRIAASLYQVIEDLNRESSKRVSEGLSEQRENDMVTRAQYNQLERRLNSERKEFEEKLARLRSGSDTNDCINRDMPVSLQRRITPREE